MHARALCLAVSVALLVGCIPDTERDATPERVTTADPAARAGGRVVVEVPPPGGIDPSNLADPSGRLIVATMCDQLIALDPVTGEPVPGLARSWTISDRGLRLFLSIRRGVRFANGRELVADDVAYTLSRIADERYASFAAPLVEPIAGFEFVHGDAETSDDRLRRRLVGVSVIDPYNVQITLRSHLADFLRTLADPATTPVPREEVERDPAAFARAPVCAGPYRVAEPWESERPLVLTRNASYAGYGSRFTARGRGYADEIVFRPHAGRRALRDGVDLARVPETLDARTSPGVRLVEGSTGLVEFVGLPTSRPPFDARAVRVALSQALDRGAIARDVFEGRRAPATGIVPPVLPGHFRRDACGASAPASGDVSAARATLRAAGIDLAGQRITLTFNPEFRNRALAEAVVGQWERALGVRVELRALPWERVVELAQRPEGIDGAFRFAWEPPVTSAEAMLVPLFHENGIGRDNLSRFGSRDFNEAVTEAHRATLDDDRRRAYARAESVVCEQMPMIPVVTASRRFLVRESRIGTATGRWVDVTTGQPVVRELFVR